MFPVILCSSFFDNLQLLVRSFSERTEGIIDVISMYYYTPAK